MKYIPLEKQSKKAQREYHKKQRNTWTINPATRKENKNKWKERKYNEKTASHTEVV